MCDCGNNPSEMDKRWNVCLIVLLRWAVFALLLELADDHPRKRQNWDSLGHSHDSPRLRAGSSGRKIASHDQHENLIAGQSQWFQRDRSGPDSDASRCGALFLPEIGNGFAGGWGCFRRNHFSLTSQRARGWPLRSGRCARAVHFDREASRWRSRCRDGGRSSRGNPAGRPAHRRRIRRGDPWRR